MRKFAGVIPKSLMLAAVMSCSTATAFSADYTPTLEENSGYTLNKVNTSDTADITTYSMNDVNETYNYTDYDGNVQTIHYVNTEIKPEYYQINIKESTKNSTLENKYQSFHTNITTKEMNGGSVLQNSSTIDSIENTLYKNNYSTINATKDNDSSYDNNFYGGAVYNEGTILPNESGSSIVADFVQNYIKSGTYFTNYQHLSASMNLFGGALANLGTISNIEGNFIQNYITNTTTNKFSTDSYGGAIANLRSEEDPTGKYGTIGNITGDFVGNYTYSSSPGNSNAYGGAIYNLGEINTITGDFIKNYAKSNSPAWNAIAEGGAIYNDDDGQINIINGNFIGNYAESFLKTGNASHSSGGAILNYGTINEINGNFIDNYAKADSNNEQWTLAFGGAIYNEKDINKITGNFIRNKAIQTGRYDTRGGAIYNSFWGRINTIEGNFTENEADIGGAIYNEGLINQITGNFSSNKADYGSAIDNSGGTILEIKNSLFSNNEITNSGGQINNIIDSIFTDNEHSIINNATINNISSDFIQNNYHSEDDAFASGILNAGLIEIINSNFVENTISSENGMALGASIAQKKGKIRKIKGNFINNTAKSNNGEAKGAAIYMEGSFLTDIDTEYGYYGSGGTIHFTNATTSEIQKIESNFVNNNTISENNNAMGGAVYIADSEILSNKIIYTYNDEFKGNYYYNKEPGNITIQKSNFFNNNSTSQNDNALGGAVYLGSKTIKENKVIIDHKSNPDTYGQQMDEAIADGRLTETPIEVNETTEIINSTFINNTAEANGTDVKAHGGAIYTKQDINIKADNGQTVFSGNKTITNGAVDAEGIYVDNHLNETDPEFAPVTLTFNTTNNGLIHLDDKVNGAESYNIELTGDNTGRTVFNNTVNNASIRTNDGSNTYLTHENNWNNNIVTLNGGSLSMVNNGIGVSHLNTLTVTNDTKVSVDVDLAGKSMDRFTADNYGTHSGNVVVAGINLLSDSIDDNTYIDFAEEGLRNNVSTQISEVNKNTQLTEAYTPIYKYGVEYMNNSGQFLFSRGDKNSSDSYNPSILVTPVASQAGGQATITESFKYVFQHADSFTQLPSMERFTQLNANKYALNSDFSGVYSPLTNIMHNSGVWVRPYTALETIKLKNGPKVDTTTYGTIVGFDSNFREMKNGWHNVFTGYLGYTGATLNYNGVDTSMNGGMLGLTETFYKGNFFTAITASAGASVGQSHTMYGSEDFTSLLAGIGSKTGYNFEFNNGKFIIQPVMFLSYTFVNTFDYTNASGNRIESDPLHSIQINPSVKFIGNLKGGWQPYASVGMVWNVMDETKVTADNIKLPEMSMKPYVEYGLGVQRNWAEKYTAFLQTMIRNGGRNGISFTGGFRMMLGDPKGRDLHELKQQTL